MKISTLWRKFYFIKINKGKKKNIKKMENSKELNLLVKHACKFSLARKPKSHITIFFF